MVSAKTRRYIMETINHPYAGIKILPFVGDFCGQATGVAKSLYAEDVVTFVEYTEIIDLISQVERHQNETALQKILSMFKKYAGVN